MFEADGSLTITVNRSGDTTAAATVDYATDDTGTPAPCGDFNGLASSKCDFTTALGRLQFAANETQKTFSVLVNRDSYTSEIPFDAFTVKLSNLTGGAVFGTSSTATTTIDLQLTPQQRSEIYNSVSKQKVSRTPPPANLHVALGGDLPASMELYDLPPNISADMPATKLYKYTLVQNQVVIVDPTKMKVIDIIRQ